MRNKLTTFSITVLLLFGMFSFIPSGGTEVTQIVDETKTLYPGQYWPTGVSLDAGTTVHVEIIVESGPAVDFYVMDESNYEEFEAGNYSDVEYYEEPSSQQTKEFSTEFSAPKEGNFYFLVMTTSLTENTDVHVLIEKTGGFWRIAIPGVIAVGVIIVVVWFLMKRRREKEREAREQRSKEESRT